MRKVLDSVMLLLLVSIIAFAFILILGDKATLSGATADDKTLDEKTGKALPQGGGEPGKAYQEFDAAVRSGNLEILKKFAPSEEEAKKYDDPRVKKMMELMKEMRATGIKITKGFIRGNNATLFVEGKDPISGGMTAGSVNMTKLNNSWRIESENWEASVEKENGEPQAKETPVSHESEAPTSKPAKVPAADEAAQEEAEKKDQELKDLQAKLDAFLQAQNKTEKEKPGTVAQPPAAHGGEVLAVSTPEDGQSLILAAYEGRTQDVLDLIQKGVPVDFVREGDSHTALLFALEQGHPDTARALIQAGANVNFKDIQGKTPLFIAVKGGDLETVRLLIQKKASVNVKNESNSILEEAIEGKGGAEVIKLLIQAGANVNSGADSRTPPLLKALNYRKPDIAKALIEAGADVNARDSGDGENAVLISIENGYVDLIPLLKKHKADINAKDKDGNTPLLNAVDPLQKNQLELARTLIANGADLNIPNGEGETPLMIAVTWNQPEVVKALLDAGANTDARNQKGETAADLAKYHPEIAKILLYAKPGVRQAETEQVKKMASMEKVTGTAHLNGKPAELKHVYAWIKPGFGKSNDLVVLFTEQPIADPLDESSTPPPGSLQLTFSLTSPDSVSSGAVLYENNGSTATSSTTDRIIVTSLDANKVEGRAFRREEKSNTGWDLTFAASLGWKKGLQPAPQGILGALLPADGGAPFKAYEAYLDTVRSGSLPAILKLTAEPMGKFFGSPMMKQILPAAKGSIPSAVLISGFSDGKSATLFLRQKDCDKAECMGIAKLILIGDQWKVSADLFVSFL